MYFGSGQHLLQTRPLATLTRNPEIRFCGHFMQLGLFHATLFSFSFSLIDVSFKRLANGLSIQGTLLNSWPFHRHFVMPNK